MKKLLVLLCIFLLPMTLAWSTGYLTYYIDAISGSDANSGLTALAPWKTNSMPNQNSAKGNTYLFHAPQIFGANQNDTCRVVATDSTTDSSYGTGMAVQDASRHLTGWTNANQVANVYKRTKTVPDSTYAMWVNRVLCTRVMTEAALTSNNRFVTWPDSTKIFLTAFADTANVWGSKNNAIHTINKSNLVISNLRLTHGTGISITGSRSSNIYLQATGRNNSIISCVLDSAGFSGARIETQQTSIKYSLLKDNREVGIYAVGDSGYIYNNDFINGVRDIAISSGPDIKGWIIENNIFSGVTTWFISFDYASTYNYIGSNNCFYAASYTNKWNMGPSNYSTLAEWQAATGQEANSITGNPLFVNSATGDYSVRYNSPARNSSVGVSLTSDLLGQPVSGTIGAIEYWAPAIKPMVPIFDGSNAPIYRGW